MLEDVRQPSSAALEGKLTGKLRRLFFEQRGRVLEKLAAISNSTGVVDSGPTAWLDLNAEDVRLVELLRPAFAEALDSQAADEAAKACSAEYLSTRATYWAGINERTRHLLDETLGEGMANEEQPEQFAARVREIFNEAAARRAPELAQAEAAAFCNSIQQP